MGAHTAAAHLNDEEKQFLELVAGPALKSQCNFQIPACTSIAQAILESGWGQSQLFTVFHNPFGIKYAHRQGLNSFPYEACILPTAECVGGKSHLEMGEFQYFETLQQAFNAHAMLLSLNRYRAAKAVADDWRKFVQALMLCGYSTDRPPLCQVIGCRHYAQKLIDLVDEFHLDDADMLRQWALGGQVGRSADGQIGRQA